MEIFNQPLLKHYRHQFHGWNLSIWKGNYHATNSIMKNMRAYVITAARQFSNQIKTKIISILAWWPSFWRENGCEYEVKIHNKVMKKVWLWTYICMKWNIITTLVLRRITVTWNAR